MRAVLRLVVVTLLVGGCAAAIPSGAGPSAGSPGGSLTPASILVPEPSGPGSASPVGSPSEPSGLPPVTPIADLPTATAITDIGEPDWLAIAGDSVWAAGVGNGIGRFDLATGKQKQIVPMGGVCLAMDVAYDSLWVGDCDASRLDRIDPKLGAVTASVDLPAAPSHESSVAAGENAVWVTVGGSQRLVRIDPKTNRITTTIDTPAIAGALRAGLGALWYVSTEGTVVRLDPRTGATVATIPVGSVPRFTAIGGGSVWVLNQADGTVSRIDAKTNAVTATITVSTRAVQGGDMAFGGGFAWARVSDALVAQIDPSTNAVVRRIGDPAGSGSVAANDDTLWISAHDVHTVWRVPLR